MTVKCLVQPFLRTQIDQQVLVVSFVQLVHFVLLESLCPSTTNEFSLEENEFGAVIRLLQIRQKREQRRAFFFELQILALKVIPFFPVLGFLFLNCTISLDVLLFQLLQRLYLFDLIIHQLIFLVHLSFQLLDFLFQDFLLIFRLLFALFLCDFLQLGLLAADHY